MNNRTTEHRSVFCCIVINAQRNYRTQIRVLFYCYKCITELQNIESVFGFVVSEWLCNYRTRVCVLLHCFRCITELQNTDLCSVLLFQMHNRTTENRFGVLFCYFTVDNGTTEHRSVFCCFVFVSKTKHGIFSFSEFYFEEKN